jgi:outer membrane protein OmpA-like peptidoglycan-associated protein
MRSSAYWLLAAVAVAAIPAAGSACAQQYQIQQPKGPWQTPGQIQHPTGPWQVPKGIQAIKTTAQPCGKKYTVNGDALFAFNKYTLSPDAEKTLNVLGPMLKKSAGSPVHIDGYTDSIGSASYNMMLSDERAKTVADWLGSHGYIPASTPYAGHGMADPVAPNTKRDGSDNPAGRAQNRRVVITVGACH